MDLSLSVLSQLFDNLPLGIVVLNARGEVVIFNRTEERLAGRLRTHVIGRSFFEEIAPCMNVRQLGGEFVERIGRSAIDVNVEFTFPFPFFDEPRDVRVKMSSFDVGSDPYAFLMIEDISIRRSIERMKETLQGLLVHDLKNPLSAVLANLQFFRDLETVRDNKDAQEAIADSIHSAERLQSMIVNLLDITRLETNTLPLSLAKVDVFKLLSSVAQDNAATAKLDGVVLTALPPPSPLSVVLDAAVMRRALDNLVENAIRHSKHVTLTAHQSGDKLVVEVRDDGAGIPEDIRSAIFDKYVKVNSGGAQRDYNRGLGLTFVRLAARAHGGDVSVECPASGGSVFRVSCAIERRRSSLPVPLP